jgi:hypothetical protein
MRYSSSEDSAITQQRQVMNLKSHFATVAAIAVLGGYAATALPDANAQLSPNCERNGKRDYCAITPIAGATSEKQSFDMITFADHAVYEITRNLESCKKISEKVQTCNAKSSRRLETLKQYPPSTEGLSTRVESSTNMSGKVFI